jgi:hypothetical protein
VKIIDKIQRFSYLYGYTIYCGLASGIQIEDACLTSIVLPQGIKIQD